MSHRRSYDPKAPLVCREPAAVEPQEPPEVEEAELPVVETGGQEAPQEAPEPVESGQPPADVPVSEDDVPENAGDVVAWVGQNPHRARAALAREAHRPKPRKTVAALAKLLDG